MPKHRKSRGKRKKRENITKRRSRRILRGGRKQPASYSQEDINRTISLLEDIKNNINYYYSEDFPLNVKNLCNKKKMLTVIDKCVESMKSMESSGMTGRSRSRSQSRSRNQGRSRIESLKSMESMTSPGNQTGGANRGNYGYRRIIRDGIIVSILGWFGWAVDGEYGGDEQAPAPGADFPTALTLIVLYLTNRWATDIDNDIAARYGSGP
jgi:hypothetical protein